MIFYVLRSDGAYVEFGGMSQDTIVNMLAQAGWTCQFIDQATYQAALAKKVPAPSAVSK